MAIFNAFHLLAKRMMFEVAKFVKREVERSTSLLLTKIIHQVSIQTLSLENSSK